MGDRTMPSTTQRDVPYPITIGEARYRGTYAHGQWILVAGLYHPRTQCDAWAGDVDCMAFWHDRQHKGPLFTVEVERGPRTEERDAYAAAGNDTTELIDDLFRFYGDSHE